MTDPTASPGSPEAVQPAAKPTAEAPVADAPAFEASATPAAEVPVAEAPAADASAAKPSGARAPRPRRTPPARPKRAPDFEALLLAELMSGGALRRGDRLRARVSEVTEQGYALDIGRDRPGFLAASEPLAGVDDDSKPLQVGDEVAVTVADPGEPVRVVRAARYAREKAVLRQAEADGSSVQGKVVATNKGGFDVMVGSFRAFCPISQIDRLYTTKPESYVGDEYGFKVVEFKDGGRRFVVSRRAILEEERAGIAAQTRETLAVGQEHVGVVVRVQPFGAFVDIGGVEGLVHVSELRHERTSDARKAAAVGQSIPVKILSLENLGNPGERVSLSAKALAEDPWEGAVARFREGMSLEGKVKRLTDYGAFVEIAPGVDGLVHISEMSRHRVDHPRDLVKPGQEVEVTVKAVDHERRRVGLSMKDSSLAQAAAPTVEVGTKVKGTVANVQPYGVFLRITEPVKGLDGLIPRPETGADPGADLVREFPKGKLLEATVLQVDGRGRIRLSLLDKPGSGSTREPPRRRPAERDAPASLGIMAEAFKRAQR